ncbi:MAG: hypothetical protein ABR568_00885 [Pyrinomonadaceae bacterium]
MSLILNARSLSFHGGIITGEPFSVTGQVRTHFDNVISHRRSFSVSENGVLVFDPFPNRLRNQLIWVDREGKQTGSPAGPDNVSKLRLSPDDKRFIRKNDAKRPRYYF